MQIPVLSAWCKGDDHWNHTRVNPWDLALEWGLQRKETHRVFSPPEAQVLILDCVFKVEGGWVFCRFYEPETAFPMKQSKDNFKRQSLKH